MSDLQKTIRRLKGMTSNAKGGSLKYFKAKKGKNNLLFLKTEQTGDPFLEWGFHKNLLDPAWKGVPCSKFNKNETCLACTVVEDLKKSNWKGNMPLWKPIEQKVEFYSPVIDLDDLAAGLQWYRYGKSVLSQMQNWLINLEEDESPFYELTAPEKVIVTYDPDADPALMYKLDKKSLKTLPENIEELLKGIKPLTELITFEKTEEEMGDLLNTYMSQAEAALEEAEEKNEEAEEKSEEETVEKEAEVEKTIKPIKSTKLDKLKS